MYLDPYAVLYKDDGDLVNEVLDDMWQKQIFNDSFKEDIELDSQKKHDPSTKMKLRHLQVPLNMHFFSLSFFATFHNK